MLTARLHDLIGSARNRVIRFVLLSSVWNARLETASVDAMRTESSLSRVQRHGMSITSIGKNALLRPIGTRWEPMQAVRCHLRVEAIRWIV